jgi:tyrosinase
MARTRMDVWNRTDAEGTWPDVLVAYARAVETMRALDPATGKPDNPLSWQFQAAMHGRATRTGSADRSNSLWSRCQHGSWFFLPWHRMYLAAFEAVVQHHLGDEEWSLPYWYALDPDRPASAVLPPAFREARADNHLFTENRSVLANGGDPLPDVSASVTEALQEDTFSTDTGISSFGGGERSRPSFFGEEMGALEDTPHGFVHVVVGNDFDASGQTVREGWMGSFFTAGLDPVFWLHHANLDRLWQVWLEVDPAHQNPPDGDPAWFRTKFRFPAPGGGTRTYRVGDVLDTTVLGYTYESLAAPSTLPAPPPAPPPGPGGGIEMGGGDAPAPRPHRTPQVIGATQDVSLAAEPRAVVELSEPADIGLGEADATEPTRVYLRLEGITGTAAAPAYEVYLNLPARSQGAEHPELLAGRLATFGLAEASRGDSLHGGAGLTKVFDITGVRDTLADRGRWDPAQVTVTFEAVVPTASDEEALGQATTHGGARPPDLRAARVVVLSA